MSKKTITFQHIDEDGIQFAFVASDENFKILSINDIEVCNAYHFMDQLTWFIKSESYIMVKR